MSPDFQLKMEYNCNFESGMVKIKPPPKPEVVKSIISFSEVKCTAETVGDECEFLLEGTSRNHVKNFIRMAQVLLDNHGKGKVNTSVTEVID